MNSGVHFAWAYWPHVIFGVSSVFFVLAAIFSAKGSKLHRSSGRLFGIAMGIAAVSALVFSFVQFAPAAIFSAVTVLYGLGMGILSLRKRYGWQRGLQWSIVLIPLLVAITALIAIGSLVLAGPEAPPVPPLVAGIAGIAVAGVGIFFGIMAFKDIKFLRQEDVSRLRRFRRHALRMGVAAAEVVRAPLMSFGPAIGPDGGLSFPVYFFGPFFLIPIIYFLAMPRWIKREDELRAGTFSRAAA